MTPQPRGRAPYSRSPKPAYDFDFENLPENAVRWAARTLAVFGLFVLLIWMTPVTSWWARALAGTAWVDPKAAVLVVLGGDYLPDGTIGLRSYWRTVYANRAWAAGGVGRIVVCGAVAGPEMKRFLVARGIPASSIEVEGRSNSTRENALFTKALLAGKPGRVILMTSEYHMFRARRAFEKAGLTMEGSSVPDVLKDAASWHSRWNAFWILSEESAKIGYYWGKGWI